MCPIHKNAAGSSGIPPPNLYLEPLGLRFVSTEDPQEVLGVLPRSSRSEGPEDLGAAPVLVSACLAGRPCRFDGTGKYADAVGRLQAEGRAVLVCPEVDGGLSTPRPPAEIVPAPGVGGPADGGAVLDGLARVVTRDGLDVTEAYLAGARKALDTARRTGAKRALLKARSPSCGSGQIYDGTFSATIVAGDGVTAALLRRAGIEIFTEEQDLGAL